MKNLKPKKILRVTWKELLTFRKCPRKMVLQFLGVRVREYKPVERKKQPTIKGKEGELAVKLGLEALRQDKKIVELGKPTLFAEEMIKDKRVDKRWTVFVADKLLYKFQTMLPGEIEKIGRIRLKSSLSQTVFIPDGYIKFTNGEVWLYEVKNTMKMEKDHKFQLGFYRDATKFCGTSIIGENITSFSNAILIYPHLKKIITLKPEPVVREEEIIVCFRAKKLGLGNFLPELKGHCSNCAYLKVCRKMETTTIDITTPTPEITIANKLTRNFGKTILDELHGKTIEEVDIPIDDYIRILQKSYSDWNIELVEFNVKEKETALKILSEPARIHSYPKLSYDFVKKARKLHLIKINEKQILRQHIEQKKIKTLDAFF